MQLPGLQLLHSYIARLLSRKKQYNNLTIKQFRFGFTLIELLVVISIIAILVAAATVSWTQAQKKARDGKRKSDLKSLQQAFELYFEENNSYPADNGSGQIQCHDNTTTPTIITWGTSFTCNFTSGARTYMNSIPNDPQGINSYFYEAFFSKTVNGKDIYLTYQLNAALENPNDPDYCQANCANALPIPILPCDPLQTPIPLSYCVIQP